MYTINLLLYCVKPSLIQLITKLMVLNINHSFCYSRSIGVFLISAIISRSIIIFNRIQVTMRLISFKAIGI